MRHFLLLLLCLSATAQSQRQTTINKQNPQQEIQKPSANQPIAKSSESVAVQSKVSTNIHQEQDRAQRVKEVNDTLLVIFTGLLVAVGYLQWLVLRKHEEWMKKHDAKLEKLANAAEQNAVAAKLNTEILKESQRPQIAAALVGNEKLFVTDAPRI